MVHTYNLSSISQLISNPGMIKARLGIAHSVEKIKNCFFKEIGILKQFVLKKSYKIGKSVNFIHERHLAIILHLLVSLSQIVQSGILM